MIPSDIYKMLECRLASSEPGNDRCHVELGFTDYLFATGSPSDRLFSPGLPGRPKIPAFCHTTRRPAKSDNTARFLPLSIPAHWHLEDCGRPTAVLGSRHKGIDSEAGTSPSRAARRTGISPFVQYFCRSGYLDAGSSSSKKRH